MEDNNNAQTVSDDSQTETQPVADAPVTTNTDDQTTLALKAEKEKLIKENVERKKLNKALEAKTLELEQNHQLTLAEKEKIQNDLDAITLKIADLESENSILKSKAEAFDKIQLEKKTALLSTISEELQAEFADLPLEKLESIIAKLPKSNISANSFGANTVVPNAGQGVKTSPTQRTLNNANPLSAAQSVAPNLY